MKLLKLGETWWDSFYTVINRIREIYPDILNCLNQISKDTKNMDFTDTEKERAK